MGLMVLAGALRPCDVHRSHYAYAIDQVAIPAVFCVMQSTLVRADGMADCGQHIWSLWLLLVPLRAFLYLIISMHTLLVPRMSYSDADSDSWPRRTVRRLTGMESVQLVRHSRLRLSCARPPPRFAW